MQILAESEDVHSLKLRRVTHVVLRQVENGSTLTVAFESALMPATMLRLIRIAEETGELEHCLELLASVYKERLQWKRKMISIITYPILLVFTSTILLFCITQFVLPQFQSMYTMMGIGMGRATRIVLFAVHDVLPSLILFAMVVCCTTSVFWYYKRKDTRILIHLLRQIKMLPKLGSFLRLSLSIAFVDSLVVLLQGGIALLESLSILTDSNHHPVIAYMAQKMLNRLLDGYSIDFMAMDLPISTDLQIMLQTADRTGDLVACMELALQMMRDEWMFQIENVAQRIQPLVIVFLGTIVCGVVLVMILPLYDVMGHI